MFIVDRRFYIYFPGRSYSTVNSMPHWLSVDWWLWTSHVDNEKRANWGRVRSDCIFQPNEMTGKKHKQYLNLNRLTSSVSKKVIAGILRRSMKIWQDSSEPSCAICKNLKIWEWDKLKDFPLETWELLKIFGQQSLRWAAV